MVFAGRDPNPRVSGGGAKELAAAGVAVEGGVMERAAEPLNRGFFTRMRRGVPYVRSKLAVSLDGRTALANGESQWITSAAARADVHRWRARSSAVVTGSGTIVDDDPSLDARREEAQIAESLGIKQPLRVVIDARLKMPPGAKTLSRPGEVLVLTTRALDDPKAEALRAAGARVDRIAGDAEHCDLRAVLEHLGALEINDVWVEAGAGLNGALLRSRAHRRAHYLYGAASLRQHGARHVRSAGARGAGRRNPCDVRGLPQGRRRLADHGARQ